MEDNPASSGDSSVFQAPKHHSPFKKLTNKIPSLSKRTMVLLIILLAIPVTIVLALTSQTFFNHAAGPDKSLSFVSRQGADLYVNGSLMKFAGSNIDNLAYNQSAGCCNATPGLVTHAFIDEYLNKAQAMGANVGRSFAVLTVGCADKAGMNPAETGHSVVAGNKSTTDCIEPTKGVFYDGTNGHPNNYEPLDYAISEAKKKNIRFILPLVNHNTIMTGSTNTYLVWEGKSTDNNGVAFYTDLQVRDDFKAHIDNVLNHVNPYTGIAYKDDPTIMGWELGNELSVCNSATYPTCQNNWPSPTTYTDWAQDISGYIKSIDNHHLVADGLWTINNNNVKVDLDTLYKIPTIDMYWDHVYFAYQTPDYIKSEAAKVRNAGKAFYLGEFSWNDKTPAGGDNTSWKLDDVVNVVKDNNINGALFWQLVPDTVPAAGLQLHYPGDDSGMQARVQKLTDFAYALCPQGGTCRSILTTDYTPTPTTKPSVTPTPTFKPTPTTVISPTHAPTPSRAPTPTSRLTGHAYTGFFDAINCSYLSGWAADVNNLNSATTVDVYIDGVKFTTITANKSRPDLARYLRGSTLHGFTSPTYAVLKDGKTHLVRLQYGGTGLGLGANNKNIKCVPTTTSTP